MLIKDIDKMKSKDVAKNRERRENVSEAFAAMEIALETLGPALDAGLNAVKESVTIYRRFL